MRLPGVADQQDEPAGTRRFALPLPDRPHDLTSLVGAGGPTQASGDFRSVRATQWWIVLLHLSKRAPASEG